MNNPIRDARWLKPSLALIAIISSLVILGLQIKVNVLEISSPNRVIRVCESEELTHSYTHSMYLEPVDERFTIVNGRLQLVAVNTPSVAVLEYFGLNSENTSGLKLFFDSFTIPVASAGNHSVKIGNAKIDLWTGASSEEKIEIRISKVNLFNYLFCLFWG